MSILVVKEQVEADASQSERSVCPPAATADHMQKQEQEWMQRISQGDAESLRELLSVHGNDMARLIGRLTAWHVDQEDILQQVMIVIWRKAGSFRGEASLRSWLRRVVINSCRNHFRMTARWKRKVLAWSQGRAQEYQDRALQVLEINESLQRGLSELSTEDRMLVVLYYLEQLPGDQVAMELGISQATLHARLHRVRVRLKSIISDD
ncbi:MAG: RNA polymerase sigma factor [Planctomycetales bacterium]|nr:RNA polymerase sigma factor [Planctomycetales bacterium]